MVCHKMNIFLALFLQNFAICTITSMAQLQSPPLQDFCVADLNSTLFINGIACKDPTKMEEADFFLAGPTRVAFVGTLPGLNTMGVRLNVLTFPPASINRLHFHPRSAELVYVVEGTLKAGFVTSGPDYRYFRKILKKGDVFVVPFGLLHFQLNVGRGNATAKALVFFNNDHPGTTDMPSNIFFTEPKLPIDVLTKSFQVDQNVIKQFETIST